MKNLLHTTPKLSEKALLDLAQLAFARLHEEPDNSHELVLIQNAKDLETFYPEITNASDNSLTRQGFSNPFAKKPAYPMHLAARDGNIDEIKRLIGKGMSVNGEDHMSSRPLHLASLFGQEDAVRYLIKMGADVNDASYKGETALHLALYKGNYSVAQILVCVGNSNVTQNSKQTKNPIALIVEGLQITIKALSKAPNAELSEKADKLINMLEIISDNGEKIIHYDFGDRKIPVSVILKMIAPLAPEKTLNEKIMHLSDKLVAKDTSETHYVAAKNLLQVFPTGKDYVIKLDNNQTTILKSQGHYEVCTVPLIKESLQKHLEKIIEKNDPADDLKRDVFSKLVEIFENAVELVKGIAQPETWENANTQFNEGKTVLLTTGWEGHFVADILSLPQQLFGVANSGDRFIEHKPGVNFYRMNDPTKINPDFIHEVLTNEQQIELEYHKMYQYDLVEQVTTIHSQEQRFGNCALESLRTAVNGLTYIELLNQGLSEPEAKRLAQEYHPEWCETLGEYTIDQYQATSSSLSAKAFVDIFTTLHTKIFNNTFTEVDIAHADKITKLLCSPQYINEFGTWLKEARHDPDIKPMTEFFKNYDVDIESLIRSADPTDEDSDHYNEQGYSFFDALFGLGDRESASSSSPAESDVAPSTAQAYQALMLELSHSEPLIV